MTIVPLTLKQANDLVTRLHRHHKPVQGHRYSLGLMSDTASGDTLVGAVIVGRPVARMVEQYRVAEVTRLVTDGTRNACSMLYQAAARVAKEMGFVEIRTAILASEPGTSLKAAGWTRSHDSAGGDWNRPSRGNRRRDQPEEPKAIWLRALIRKPLADAKARVGA